MCNTKIHPREVDQLWSILLKVRLSTFFCIGKYCDSRAVTLSTLRSKFYKWFCSMLFYWQFLPLFSKNQRPHYQNSFFSKLETLETCVNCVTNCKPPLTWMRRTGQARFLIGYTWEIHRLGFSVFVRTTLENPNSSAVFFITCHLTPDLWCVTCDRWQVTHRGWWTLSQHFRSLALTIWEWRYFEDLEEKDDWVT